MRINFKNIMLETSPNLVYVPSEDTFFLEDCIREYFSSESAKITRMCDMGAGTGYIGIVLKKIFKNSELQALDRNKHAVDLCNENFALNDITGTVINSNLFHYYFSNNISIKFDLIVFNPPYLPSKIGTNNHNNVNGALEGGKNGTSVIQQFLKQMEHFLSENGKCFLVLGNFNRPSTLLDKYPEYILNTQFHKQLLFESLTVAVLSLQKVK